MRSNQDSIERKKQEKVLEEEADTKILEYILERDRKLAAKDAAAKEKAAEREHELARLRAAQEKMSDKQAQQDALRAQRAAEQHEREWRRKERETAVRRVAQEAELRAERTKQSRAKEYAIAVEAHKMKQEFYDNLARQREAEARLKAEEVARGERNRAYAQEVQSQIRDKEEGRHRVRQDFFMEGLRLAQERVEGKKRLEAIKQRKIGELRAVGVPEKYCREVERQINHTKAMFSK
jgi:hypothetical protein